MKISFGSRRQLIFFAALAVLLVLAVVRMRQAGPVPAPAMPAVTRPSGPSSAADEPVAAVPRAARGEKEKKMSPDEVPIITRHDLEPPRLRPQGEGRNVFDIRPPTARPLPTSTPAPPPAPVCGDGRLVGPCPPPPPTPTPLPPEVSFKFIGTFGAKERPMAVLTQAGEVVNASEGDVVFTKFILRKIGYESIDVGFVGRDPKDTRRIGLTP